MEEGECPSESWIHGERAIISEGDFTRFYCQADSKARADLGLQP
jgi:hypothetical protein